MPTTAAPRSLSARLSAARGRPTDDVVVVIEPPPAKPERLPQPERGKQTRCTNSVMAGQRCDRMAVAGGTLCGNHRAMQGTG
ncbi:MAG: hypothetical protein JWP02_3905 [Acidimicrobiales bacterium]|nr:hypothetical protein [Acidimicrobiales bacterium]